METMTEFVSTMESGLRVSPLAVVLPSLGSHGEMRMIPSAIMDVLVSAGATPEIIAVVVKADQALAQGRLDERRARDADRQRRKRNRDIAKSRHVTRTHADSA